MCTSADASYLPHSSYSITGQHPTLNRSPSRYAFHIPKSCIHICQERQGRLDAYSWHAFIQLNEETLKFGKRSSELPKMLYKRRMFVYSDNDDDGYYLPSVWTIFLGPLISVWIGEPVNSYVKKATKYRSNTLCPTIRKRITSNYPAHIKIQ